MIPIQTIRMIDTDTDTDREYIRSIVDWPDYPSLLDWPVYSYLDKRALMVGSITVGVIIALIIILGVKLLS